MISEVLKNWNVTAENVNQIYETTWNVDDKYILKRYTDRDALQRNIQIMEKLQEQGIPVANIVAAVDGKKYCELEGTVYFLTEKLPGRHPSDIREKGLAYRIGEIIGKLHQAFQKCENGLELRESSILEEMEGWIREELEKKNWELVSKEYFTALIEELGSMNPLLPRQMIHRDMHFGNILLDGDQFTGYIDFDLSQKNVRIFDVCYFLAGQLTDEAGARITDEEWLNAVNEILNGYAKVMKLEAGERRSVFLIMQSIELLFAAYFAKIGNMKLAQEAADIAKRIAGIAAWVLPEERYNE